MKNKRSREGILPAGGLSEIIHTVSGLPPAGDHLATRLQYVADIVGAIRGHPAMPLLAWREENGSVQHVHIEAHLVVGRQPDAGLTFAQDDLLSRRHFAIHKKETAYELEDLGSRNGTAVSSSGNRVRSHILHDGDLIYAGRRIFVYLNPLPA